MYAIRRLDCPFGKYRPRTRVYLALMNEPAYIHYIGDRGIRTIENAENVHLGQIGGQLREVSATACVSWS